MSPFLLSKSLKPMIVKASAFGLVLTAGLLLMAPPALAHHPFGGETPSSAIQGFLSGLGHPVIGPDHLAFVIASGLLAAVIGHGLRIPLGFVLASLAGTGIHLMGMDLPAPELWISFSVMLFGVLLALKTKPNVLIIVALASLAGVFHGYAYGEAIVGADMAPLLAYLLGFTGIQMAIAASSYGFAEWLKAHSETAAMTLRFTGFTLAGVGFAFLSGVVLG